MCVKGPFLKIHIDYCEPFTRSSIGKEYLIPAIEAFTKFVIARAVSANTALNAAKLLVTKVFLVHGCPQEILSDLGTHFTGSLF